MRVRVLASAPDNGVHQFLTTFLIDDLVAIDAGCVGFYRDPKAQAQITSVFLGHSHADHVCSLPMFLMNIEDEADKPLAVYGSQAVLDSLRTDMFNGRVWPDFLAFTRDGRPLVTLTPLESEQPVAIERLTVTPVAVDHVVPTFGFLVDDGTTAVAFSSDSAPTERLWALARKEPRLRAVFLGVSFPDSLEPLARKAGHLTPGLARGEIDKLPRGIDVIAVHIKASHREVVVNELRALGLTNVVIGESGHEYVF